MIDSRTVYFLRCDECKGLAGGHVQEPTRELAVLTALEHGWVTTGGQHFCPNCICASYLHLKYRSGSSE